MYILDIQNTHNNINIYFKTKISTFMNSFRGPILCSPEWALKVGFRTYTHINHLVSTHWYGILSHHVLLPSSKVCAGQVMPCALWGLPRLPHTLVSNLSPMILAQCHKNCTST